jgi:hypothetical protein
MGASLPRIRLTVHLTGQVKTLLGYLVTDSNGVVWAIPEISHTQPAATDAMAFQLDLAKIDKAPVAGRSHQVISYRDVLYAPEATDSGDSSDSGRPCAKHAVKRRTLATVNGKSRTIGRRRPAL